MTHRVLAVCLAATVATAAHAQPPAPSPRDDAEEAPAPPQTRWYGWEGRGEGRGPVPPAFGGRVGKVLGSLAGCMFSATEPVSPPGLPMGPALPMDRRRGGGLALTLRF